MTIEEDYDLSNMIDRISRLADGLQELSMGGLPSDFEFTEAAKYAGKALKGVSTFLQAVRRTETDFEEMKNEVETLKEKLAQLENRKVIIP